MRRRAAWVVVLVPLVASSAELAGAQPLSPAGGPPAVAAPVVEMVVVGGGHDAFALLDTLRDLLGRVGLVLEAHAVATPAEVVTISRGSAVARVEVDLRSPSEAVVVIEGRRQGPKQRTVRRDPSPSIAREELAQAIQSGVEAQLFADPEGRAAAPLVDAGDGSDSAPPSPPVVPPPEPSAPPVASAPPPPQPSLPADVPLALPLAREAAVPSRAPAALGVDISTLAGGGWFASGSGPVAALGGDVTVAGRRGWRPSLSLSARAVLPFGGSEDSVTGHASAFAIRALAGVEVVRTSFIALVGGAGGGADVLWASPSSAVLPPSVLGADTTRADPVVSAFAAAHVRLVPSVVLTVMALGDLDLAPSRYVVVEGSSVEPVLAPWRVRPTLLAGFTFTALGQPTFPRESVP
jgi:hypothetical protein